MADLNQQAGYPNMIGNMQGNRNLYPYNNNAYNLMMNTPYENYMNQNRGQQQQSFNNNQNQFLKCRPVSSKEEARASQIDLDGSLWVFTDIGNGNIYTKQINADGTATFKTYHEIEDEKPSYIPSGEYVTKEEFNRVIQNLMAAMQVGNGGRTSYYTELPEMRDPREGRSPMRRRMYMEGKEAHNDPNSQLRELEAYLQELSTDITEMIKDASPEERATLHQKMTTLANKMA